MKKTDAIKLEELCQEYIKKWLPYEYDITISMALTGRLKVEVDDWYVTFDKQSYEPEYTNYHGSFSSLVEITMRIKFCMENNNKKFQELVWTYEHISELED